MELVHESLYNSGSIGIDCYCEAPCGLKLGKSLPFVRNGRSVTGLKMFHVVNSLRARSLSLLTVTKAEMKTSEGLALFCGATPSSTDGSLDLVYQLTILNQTQFVEVLRYKPESCEFDSR